jgi:hypothetical protein
MHIPGHIGFSLAIWAGWRRGHIFGRWREAAFVACIAILPDVFDRILNLLFGFWSHWHGLFHSFLLSIPLTIAALLFYRKSLIWCLLLFIHPFLDIVNVDIRVLFWPFVKEVSQLTWMKSLVGWVALLHVTLNDQFARFSTGHYVIFEIVGLCLCLVVAGMLYVRPGRTRSTQ